MCRSLTLVVLFSLFSSGFLGCRPLAEEGASCTDAPCAQGLRCEEGICAKIIIPEEPPPECRVDSDCELIDESAVRRCENEECVFASCGDDDDCGEGFECLQERCFELESPCVSDEECDTGICEEGDCIEACEGDSCGQLFSCGDDGRCRQQCLGFDFLCFGGLCDPEGCIDRECDVDEECPGENAACNDGRCGVYTPCQSDEACFDANVECSDEGRCVERPTCLSDAECGERFLCIDAHCRDATSCDEGCSDSQECVQNRCVQRPQCRSNDQCEPNETCIRNLCLEVDNEDASRIALATPLGLCEEGGGACRMVLFERETFTLDTLGFDQDAQLMAANFQVSDVPGLQLSLDAGVVSVQALSPGEYTLRIVSGERVHERFVVRVLRDNAEERRVVVSEHDGRAVENAAITIDGVVYRTDAEGVANLPNRDYRVLPIESNGRGLMLVGAFNDDVRVFFDQRESSERAGVVATVQSSGDELGAVGAGLVIPSVRNSFDLSTDSLFGRAFFGAAEVPVIGEIPLALPQAATLVGTLPIVGDIQIKESAFVSLSEGRSMLTAYEGRFEQNELFTLAPAGIDGFIARMAEVSEYLDVHTQALPFLGALPPVIDTDDVDGDGDSGENIENWNAFERLSLVPERRPTERVEVVRGPRPGGASLETLAVLGLDVPGIGFMTTGFTILEEASAQVRVQSPVNPVTARANRVAFLEARFDDGRQSRSFFRANAFASVVEIPELLRAGWLFDVVSVEAGIRFTPLSPGPANAFVFRTQVGDVDWEIQLSDNASVTLPRDILGEVVFDSVEAIRVPGEGVNSFLRDGVFKSLEQRATGHSVGPLELSE